MLQRTHRAAFIPGAYVFPGGAVDPGDSDPAFADMVDGMDDAHASRLLNLAQGGMAFWVAAIRECFEEAGVLLAYDRSGKLLDAASSEALERERVEMTNGKGSFIDLCRSFALRPALDQMAYFSHWITQLGAPRRFTARFFAAVAPDGQNASHDQTETIHHLWIRPDEALKRHREGEMAMAYATVKTLELLAGFDDAHAFVAHARTIQSPSPRLPRYAKRGVEVHILEEGDAAYAEIGKLDPTGKGDISSVILPGEVVQISETVRRLTAANPGVMTGPGTNSYVLGKHGEFAVIDPGPADDAHVERLIEMTGGRIRWILVTHTHLDHSSAAPTLKQRTGAQLLGMLAEYGERQDQGFLPDLILQDGQEFDVAGCRLHAVHTPGHASNHFCYLLKDENLLFTGDHIMQGSTVIINPPDGDMAAYMDSLLKIKSLNAEYLAPGHGFLMDRPDRVIDRLMEHRLRREQKIIESLSRNGTALLSELVPLTYEDVPEHKHRAASRSLLAHLIKLQAEGRVTQSGDRWSLSESAAI